MKPTVSKLIENSLNISCSHYGKLKLTGEEKNYINTSCERIKIKKNEYIIKKGDIENHIYFIENGLFRYWAHNFKKTEMTFWFSFEGEFINSYFSIKIDKPSEFNIQAIVDSTIWKFKREDLVDTINSNHQTSNKIARMILEDALIRKTDREIMLIRNTPEQRYVELMDKYRKLILNVPLKYIASYLGITPQTLSVIRRRVYLSKY